jgi:ABC-type transport system involved in multi-copper enzyme maturation permease subunit
MTWLTWRQHRWEVAAALALLLAFGGAVVLLTIAGSDLASEIARNCQPDSHGVVPNACGSFQNQFGDSFQIKWWWIVVVGTVAPALVGMFVGAPMIAREVENGTQLLVWTQGITRRRWFLSRCGLVAAGATVGATALATAALGWFSMQHAVGSPLNLSQWDGFEIGAPVVIVYTLFALALGVAAGAAIRRTVPAIAATLVAFIATRVAIALLARPNYVPPLTDRGSLAGESTFSFGPGGASASSAWSVGPTVLYNPAGKQIPFGFCVGSGPGCFTHVTAVQQYQPGDRFWLFQGIEAAIIVVLAFALFALAYRLVMRIR